MKKQEITLPVSVAKESALSLWLKKENKLYSSIMEKTISNAQVLIHNEKDFIFNDGCIDICNS